MIVVLNQLLNQTFIDREVKLLKALIQYFTEVNIGGPYYLKHYFYSSIWEDMVTDYLSNYYKGINSNHEIVFDKIKSSNVNFRKEAFFTNEAKPEQYISPDHYCGNGSTQLIFDAKYYTDIKGMNYKQIAYMFMLKDIKDSKTSKKKYDKTFSSLILPSDIRKTKTHFKLNPSFSDDEFIIMEEYLNTREVILSYLE